MLKSDAGRFMLDALTDARLPPTGRFTADNLNKAKNLCSKSIGEKMKVLAQHIHSRDNTPSFNKALLL